MLPHNRISLFCGWKRIYTVYTVIIRQILYAFTQRRASRSVPFLGYYGQDCNKLGNVCITSMYQLLLNSRKLPKSPRFLFLLPSKLPLFSATANPFTFPADGRSQDSGPQPRLVIFIFLFITILTSIEISHWVIFLLAFLWWLVKLNIFLWNCSFVYLSGKCLFGSFSHFLI